MLSYRLQKGHSPKNSPTRSPNVGSGFAHLCPLTVCTVQLSDMALLPLVFSLPACLFECRVHQVAGVG